MSVNLIKCSTACVKFGNNTKFNAIVNISLCKALLKSNGCVSGAEDLVPSILFTGIDIEWSFYSEEERDKELERIFSLFSKGIISESKKEKEITSDTFKKIAELECIEEQSLAITSFEEKKICDRCGQAHSIDDIYSGNEFLYILSCSIGKFDHHDEQYWLCKPCTDKFIEFISNTANKSGIITPQGEPALQLKQGYKSHNG